MTVNERAARLREEYNALLPREWFADSRAGVVVGVIGAFVCLKLAELQDSLDRLADARRHEVWYEGVRFMVEPTGDFGHDTGRPRFHVRCTQCGEVVHENTTGPRPMMRRHVMERH